jgi:hypothetical protein
MPTKHALIIATAVAVLASCSPITIDAQQTQRETTTQAKAGRGSAASDANIKSATVDNRRDVAEKIPVPPAKGGVRMRGGEGWCSIRVSNSSPLHANVYVDGEFWGTTPAYGDLAGWMRCRATNLYARANFDDGSYYYWGPASVTLRGTYTWRISR